MTRQQTKNVRDMATTTRSQFQMHTIALGYARQTKFSLSIRGTSEILDSCRNMHLLFDSFRAVNRRRSNSRPCWNDSQLTVTLQ